MPEPLLVGVRKGYLIAVKGDLVHTLCRLEPPGEDFEPQPVERAWVDENGYGGIVFRHPVEVLARENGVPMEPE